jgi:hypothetical protein
MAPRTAESRPVTTDDVRAADEPLTAERERLAARERTADGTVVARQESQHVR